ncbi:MAG: hypothetical protein R3Y16_07870 [Rikenellaceae bacterium]
MRNITRIMACVALLSASLSNSSAWARELSFDVDMQSYFDNREFSNIKSVKFRSGTDFGVRLDPKVIYNFDEVNTIHFGAEIYESFGGESTTFFDSVAPILYYGFDNEKWSATMGIFERSRMAIDDYSGAFFSDDYLFFDNRITGMMGRYTSGDSYVELVCDWESQPSETTRERFRLLSSARRRWSNLYIGYNLSVTHFAGQKLAGFGNVVDNVLLNPMVGVRFNIAEVEMDGRVSYLQSLQRDRSYENEWLSPSMGEVALEAKYRGFSIDEALYFGDDLMPLYDGHTLDDGQEMEYGSLLYTGDPLFRSSGYYNRAALCYERTFFDEKVGVKVEFVTHLNEEGFSTQQMVRLNVKIGGSLYRWGQK